jgi:hypothetical protein
VRELGREIKIMSKTYKPLPEHEEWEAKQRKLQAEIEAEACKHPNYTFYFAGKIKRTGWRHGIFDLRRIDYPWDAYISGAALRIDHGIAPGLHYGGPFTVACDHGCYHGPNTRGAGVNGATCEGGGGMWDAALPCERKSFAAQIASNCLHSIASADILFAWIEDLTAYGTLAEIGFAHALGTQIWLAWSQEFPDLWFIKELATEVVIAENAELAFREIVFTSLGRSLF